MHYLIEMLIAFLVLYGIVLFFQQTLKVKFRRGYAVVCIGDRAAFCSEQPDGDISIWNFMGMLCIAGVGILLRGIQIVRKKQKVVLFSPVLVFLFGLYCVCAHYFLS